MSAKSSETITKELAERHQLPVEAVRELFDALRRSGGSMVQFDHPGLGGMGQWSGGMLMIGDMFNDKLKSKVSAVLHDLAEEMRSSPARPAETEVSYRSSSSSEAHGWWPAGLGQPGSTGSQNNMKYAVFPSSGRLAIKDGDAVSIYDTADHHIHGVSQAQSSGSTLSFTSQNGLVKVSELRKVDK